MCDFHVFKLTDADLTDTLKLNFHPTWAIHILPYFGYIAASHLASGCYETLKTSIFTGCNIHQKRDKKIAMQCLFTLSECLLYIIVKCDRLTFICDKKRKENSITQNNRMWQTHLEICSLLLLWCFWSFYLFFCDWFIFWLCQYTIHHACLKHLRGKIWGSFFVFFSVLPGGATLSAVKW